MPVISKVLKRYSGLPEFTLEVSYNPKSQDFSAKLPGFMSIPGNDLRNVTGKTQKEAEKAFDEAVKKFLQASKTIRKVIIFDIHKDDQSFTLRVAVANETTISADTTSTSSYEILQSSLKSSYIPYVREKAQTVEWSPEMEAFFAGLQARVDHIVQILAEKGQWSTPPSCNTTSHFRMKDVR
jgi:hypothetical protein